MRLTLPTAIKALAAVSALLPPSLADGFALKGIDGSRWRPLAENEQVAAIHHRNGVQRMALAVQLELEAAEDRGLWIVPVRGEPSRVRVDLIDEMPRFVGRDPRVQAKNRLDAVFAALRATQIYPMLVEVLFGPTLYGSAAGVSIRGEVEKWGLRSELLDAESIEALAAHLGEQGVQVEPEALATLAPYMGDGHALIATWIASRESLLAEFPDLKEERARPQSRRPALYVEFPTPEPFFPLQPTRGYGDEHVPLRLYVLGWVEPDQMPVPRGEYQIGHYEMDGPARTPGEFWAGLPAGEPVAYTAMRLDVAAREFTRDLTLRGVEPAGMRYAGAVSRMLGWPALGVGLCMLVLLSVAAGALAGWWSGGRGLAGFGARLGVLNLITLLGMGLVFRSRERLLRVLPTLTDEQAERLRRRYLLRFTLAFVGLTIAGQALLSLPLARPS